MSQYVLLTMAARAAADELGDVAFPLIGRTRWTATLRLGHVDAGGSVELAIEASPDAVHWAQIGTFDARAAAGEWTIRASDDPPTLAVASHHRFLRVARVSQVGGCVYEVTAEAPFLDPVDDSDMALLPKRSKEYDQGIARLLAQAEYDVLDLLRPDPASGMIDPEIATAPLFAHSVRRAVALQTDHLHDRERLQRAKEASAHVTRRELGRYGVGVREQVQAFIPSSDLVWRGR